MASLQPSRSISSLKVVHSFIKLGVRVCFQNFHTCPLSQTCDILLTSWISVASPSSLEGTIPVRGNCHTTYSFTDSDCRFGQGSEDGKKRHGYQEPSAVSSEKSRVRLYGLGLTDSCKFPMASHFFKTFVLLLGTCAWTFETPEIRSLLGKVSIAKNNKPISQIPLVTILMLISLSGTNSHQVNLRQLQDHRIYSRSKALEVDTSAQLIPALPPVLWASLCRLYTLDVLTSKRKRQSPLWWFIFAVTLTGLGAT